MVGVGEVEEQVLDLVEHLVGARVGAVDLVDHDDGRQVGGDRLRQHVAGLRERAFGRVDEEQHAVDEGQGPLDLAAEVGVTRRVDQVDLDPAPGDRGRLGQDRDPALTLLIVGVHDAVDHRGGAANVPVWRRSESTSVVFPWSTCATMATFRSAGGCTGDPIS